MEKINIGICNSRPNMPCEYYVFGKEEEMDLRNIKEIENEAHTQLVRFAEISKLEYKPVLVGIGYNDVYINRYDAECVIIATGPTIALTSVLAAAVWLFRAVTVLHCDPNDEYGYYPQRFEV